jgi:hypothetical protein
LLPVLPPQAANKIRALNPDVMDTYGWPQFVTEVAQATKTIPPGVPIFTSSYEEAGALTILGPAHGIHRAIASGHNNYWICGRRRAATRPCSPPASASPAWTRCAGRSPRSGSTPSPTACATTNSTAV